jgi:hypothetical protein
MKGLLLKDIINLKQQVMIYIAIIAMWLFLAIANKSGAFFAGVTSILPVLLPMTAIAYDEKAKWDIYALTMPVSRRDMVISRYMLAFICFILGFIMSIAVNYYISGNALESFRVCLVILALGAFFLAVILPVIFKFGVEKGRLIVIAIMVVPSLLTVMLSKMNIDLRPEKIEGLLRFSPLLILAALAISVLVSIRIYNNKEF